MAKIVHRLSAAICLAALLGGCSQPQHKRDVIFQSSTIISLLKGIYDGDTTCEELKKHGDFGIGTFNGLDGEMVVLNGKIHQIRADGSAHRAPSSLRTPFVVLTFFEPDLTLPVDTFSSQAELQKFLDNRLPTKNIFYAIKMQGAFDYVRTRSVPRQSKPYRRLAEVVTDQSIFDFRNIRGTIVGFRMPQFLGGMNIPGYHFHFITQDNTAGGHLVECAARNLKAEVDCTHALFITLPRGSEFYQLDASKDDQKEVEKVER